MSAMSIFSEKSVTQTRLESSNLLKYANDNRNEGFFNDVTLNVEGLSIPANRLVLACHSKFFESMFKTNMKEKYEPVVEIQGVSGTALKTIIHYLYTEKIDLESATILDLLSASDYLQIDDVKELCFEFLESLVNPGNCVAVLNSVKLYQTNASTNWIYQYISDHLNEVAKTNDFKNLSQVDLVACLTELKARRAEESWICQSLLLWVRHENESRKTLFTELFQQVVTVKQLSVEFIKYSLLEEELIKSNLACHELVLTTFSQLLDTRSAELTKPTHSKVISLGGKNTGSKVNDVYNVHAQNALMSYPDLPEQIYSHRALKVKNFVFCIGGVRGPPGFFKDVLKRVWKIDLEQENSNWRETGLLNEKRSEMGAAVFEDKLVVAGGSGVTTEFYDVENEVWKTSSEMKDSRENNALVACKGYLFALGGKGGLLGLETLSSMERLERLHERWRRVQPMRTPRHSLAAVSYNDMIYAIGGQSQFRDSTVLKSIEKYDPTTDEWSYVQEMKTERAEHSACVLNGKIIVLGGRNANGQVVREIESYDPVDDTWSVVGGITEELINHSIVVM